MQSNDDEKQLVCLRLLRLITRLSRVSRSCSRFSGLCALFGAFAPSWTMGCRPPASGGGSCGCVFELLKAGLAGAHVGCPFTSISGCFCNTGLSCLCCKLNRATQRKVYCQYCLLINCQLRPTLRPLLHGTCCGRLPGSGYTCTSEE
jgi:hypothetical protein